MTNTKDAWEEYVEEQQMIETVGFETVRIYSQLCRFADEYEYDRIEVIDMFCDMFQTIIDTLDTDEYDAYSKKSLS